jgi:hypothetical protein
MGMIPSYKLSLLLCSLAVASLIALHPRAARNGLDSTVGENDVTNVAASPESTPGQAGDASQKAHQAREQWRQELKEQDSYQEMFAKETEWKEKSKSIAKGMTIQQAIAVMGAPTRIETFVKTSDGNAEQVAVPISALSRITDIAFVYYSPDGTPPLTDSTIGQRLSRLPFDHLVLNFDEQGKMLVMSWVEEEVTATLSRSAMRRAEQTQQSAGMSPSSPVAFEPVTPPAPKD